MSAAQATTAQPQNLADLGIDDLLKVQVNTASKYSQELKDVPASITVLSGDDLRKGSARTIPDMLRQVPGVTVAQVNAHAWMVSIRGFNMLYSRLIQVLVDGRSIYSPLFSGVDWDEQNLMPEDIDSIEVIRGAGGSVWGANAVNGVINIITRSARETKGASLLLSRNSLSASTLRARYGGDFGKEGAYRITVGYQEANNTDPGLAPLQNDATRNYEIGLRADWKNGEKDTYTVSGHYSHANQLTSSQTADIFANPPTYQTDVVQNENWYLQSDYTRRQSDQRTIEARANVTHSQRGDFFSNRTSYQGEVRVADQYQNGAHMGYGITGRADDYVINGRGFIGVDDPKATINTVGGFIAFDKPLGPNTTFSAGTTFEHNPFTGWEVQPNARMVWKKGENNTAWLAVSRSVSTPSLGDRDIDATVGAGTIMGLPAQTHLLGSEDAVSIVDWSLESGYRWTPDSSLSVEASAFANEYLNLGAYVPGMPAVQGNPPFLLIPATFSNSVNAVTAGVEISTKYRPNDHWTYGLNYSFLTSRFWSDPGFPATTTFSNSPRHMLSISAKDQINDSTSLEFFGSSQSATEGYAIPAYARLDLALNWSPNSNTEFRLIGQNLLSTNHIEGASALTETVGAMPRTVTLIYRYHF